MHKFRQRISINSVTAHSTHQLSMKNDQEHYINDKMDEHAKNFEH